MTDEDRIYALLKAYGFDLLERRVLAGRLVEFASEVRREEREACARVAEGVSAEAGAYVGTPSEVTSDLAESLFATKIARRIRERASHGQSTGDP